MTLTVLLLTSIFFTSTAFCSRSSFKLGLMLGKSDSADGFGRIFFNMTLQTAFVMILQFTLSLGIARYSGANALYGLVVIYSIIVVIATLMLGILGYWKRKNIVLIKKNLSTFVPTGKGLASIMDVDFVWTNDHEGPYRIYNFLDHLTVVGSLLCLVVGLWWGLTIR